MAHSESVEMKNVYDVHLHAAPSIFERWGDAEDTAEACQAAGMAGIVLKAHHGSTTELASHLNGKFDVDVFGGIVLNYFVGGLNPYAVDACCALGGKIVWLPTIHAAAHKPLGGFEFQQPKTGRIPTEGIRITAEEGLAAPMQEIFEILHGQNVILATGHVSKQEIKMLVKVVRDRRLAVKLLVNHAHFFTPALNSTDIEQLKGENIWFELSHLSQKIQATTPEKTAWLIKDHPDAKWVMVSDSGQRGNRAPEALKQFRDLLLGQGISPGQLEQMMTTSPREMLY